MMKKFIIKFWPQILIFIVTFAFFSRLFFPPSIFITPDYGRSDLLHFNIPIKEVLSQSLKNGQFPLWESRIGQGFPVFDEGQIGVLYLPNLILFSFLPFWLAFNIGYVVTFMISGLGTYFLTRSYNMSKSASLVAALTFSFSPIFTLQIHHYNLIQSASLMPWLLFLANSFFKKKKFIYIALLPVFISAQIFTGFFQLAVYSQIALLIFFGAKLLAFTKNRLIILKVSSILVSAVILGYLITAPQLVATYKLTTESGRTKNITPQKILRDFPLKPLNLLTIFDPYILGSPQNGTYRHWQPGEWGIFWESNLYFGKIQLILIGALFIAVLTKKNGPSEKKFIFFWTALGTLGLLLALGPEAPLHPLFSVPPLSLFRVPSRFLLFTFMAAAMLAAASVNTFFKNNSAKNKLLTAIIVGIMIFESFRVWGNYNQRGLKSEWFNIPQITAGETLKGRVVSIFAEKVWSQTFRQKGWDRNESTYNFYRNFMAQNSNISYGAAHMFAYAGMIPKRQSAIESLALSQITEKGELTIGRISQNVINVNSVSYLTTPYPINSQNWQKLNEVSFGDQKIFLYKNEDSLPRAFAVGDWVTANTVQEAGNIFAREDFDPRKTVILEKSVKLSKHDDGQQAKIQFVEEKNNKIIVAVSLPKESLVVLSDSYYDGWKAYIDNKQTEILAANVNSRAVLVPAGIHKLTFLYDRQDIKLASIVGFTALLLVTILIAKAKALKF